MKPFPNYRDLERVRGIFWHELVQREPGLAELLWQAHRAGSVCRCWSDVDRAFTPVSCALARLIGFAGTHRGHPVLGSPAAYDIAYWKLYDAVAALVPTFGVTEAEQAPRVGTTPQRAQESITAKTAA